MADAVDRLRAALADRYRIEREVGAGGMATVFLAEDLRHQRQVAIKVLTSHPAAEFGPDRFLREIRIAARLNHPHILPLHDSGEAAGVLFYVMPYVEGPTLRQRCLSAGPLPVPEALRILRDIADAMAYAHRQGVVHRDIKPENVMLSGEHALVADFGVAKALRLTTNPSIATSGSIALGTPAYMAPEQAAGDPDVDHRADIYAWGVVAYELLSGRPPFDRPRLLQPAEPLTRYRPDLPAELTQLVMRAIEKDPEDRWPRAEDLVTRLDRLTALTSGAIPSSRLLGNHRPLAVAATVLAVLLVVSWQLTRPRLRPDPALVVVAPFENRTGNPVHDALADEMADRLPDPIARTGVAHLVLAVTAREALHDAAAGRDGIPEALAKRTGAGLVIVGTIHARGDSLEYHAAIMRQPGGTPIGEMEPVVATGGSARAVEQLAQRLATRLAALRDWGDDAKWGRDFSLPNTLEPYQSLVTAATRQARGELSGALLAYDAALSQAPGWPMARIGRAVTVWLRGAPEAAESALVAVLQTPGLPPGDRAEASRRLAYIRADWEGVYAHSREAYALAPKTMAIAACWAAISTARYEEAAGFAPHLKDTVFWNAPVRRAVGLHLCVGRALHALSRHQDELAIARTMREEYPDNPLVFLTAEIEARAGLRDRKAVEELVRESEGLEPAQSGWSLSRAVTASQELRTHGDTAGARLMAERGVAWQRTRLAQGDTTFARLEALLETEEEALQWSEAYRLLPLLGALARRPADSASVAWHRAYITIRSGGNAADITRAIAQFEAITFPVARPPSRTGPYSAARLYSAMGDTVLALVRLREAYQLGDELLRSYSIWHRELGPDLLNLPAFRQLVGSPR
ncbi:MAG TPA: serine/threonine-protein kinase [Gemmatimonadales bacterium]